MKQWIRQQTVTAIHFLRRQLTDLRQTALGICHPRDRGALMRQQCLGIGPAFVLFANTVGHRHPDIVEFHFVQAVVAID